MVAGLWPVAEHTRALVAYVVVLGSPLTRSCLIVFIRLSEWAILVRLYHEVMVHRVALGDRVASRWCLLLLVVATS